MPTPEQMEKLAAKPDRHPKPAGPTQVPATIFLTRIGIPSCGIRAGGFEVAYQFRTGAYLKYPGMSCA
jgi:hypothetical protein